MGPSGGPRPASLARTSPLRVVFLYVALSAAWFLFSGRLATAALGEAASPGEALALAGALYLLLSAALLYDLLRRADERGPSDAQLRGVLDGMADAVLVLDRSGAVVDVNRAALRLFGAERRDELLAPAAELLARAQIQDPDGQPAGADDLASLRALADETGTRYEARLRRCDGRERYVSVSSAPVPRRGAGSKELSVVVVRDISEVKRFEESREEFFCTAAHEFKTPLAAVKAQAQLMRRRGQGDPAGLDAIVRQIDRLTRLVHQLLEVARFRLGRTELRRERFDLTALLGESVDGMRPRVVGRRLLASPTEPAPVIADRDRIGQVITNLLENAVRFSPGGGDVEAALSRCDGEAVVSVRDHGLGIPPERQGRIFERYFRAHAGTPQDYGGLGVGLDVAREIVARHGGKIWFESEPGAGSTFSFSLPLAPEGSS
jgi:two-component system phosphate regulon sensor histidine kinase PhoR